MLIYSLESVLTIEAFTVAPEDPTLFCLKFKSISLIIFVNIFDFA